MHKRIQLIVTIDGPAGSGKSSTALAVARTTGLGYLDSGALYRAVALKWVESEKDPLSGIGQDQVFGEDFHPDAVLGTLELEVCVDEEGSLSFELDGSDISQRIRTEEVGAAASLVSAHPAVREYVTDIQRQFAADLEKRGIGVVVEGRDVGTVVFPHADLKYFLDARPEIRALRRVEQLRDRDVQVDFEEVLDQIRVRDKRDRDRTLAPLVPADDAIVLDTSDLSQTEIVSTIATRVRRCRESKRE